MKIQRGDLEAAAAAGILQADAVESLIAFLQARDRKSGVARFNGTHVLYYLGGMMAIGSVSLFTTLAVEALGMGALLGLSVLYMLAAFVAAGWFEKRGFGVPAGICAALSIALTPLAIFALQHLLGLWADTEGSQHYRDYHAVIDWRWLLMELATLAVGAIMLWRFRYPFMVMPIAVTLWYMGMDIVPALIMQAVPDSFYGDAAWELRKQITLAFGLVMLLVAFFVDLRSRHGKDFAFWLYLFGVMTFWGVLSSMGNGALNGKLVYLALNFGMVFVGAILGRRVFSVFGGIGIALVLGDLSWRIFKDSFAFVLILTLLGFAFIAAGIWWNKHEATISNGLRRYLPVHLRELLEARTGL
ncbi:MAG TPA: hypothetical protein VLC92_04270 [Rhodocyclaceae bacterium]|nr:hypothetical protein [Rhodocyclaceae bacterium]